MTALVVAIKVAADEAVGRTPTILKSGEQEPGVYRDLWATIRAGDVWRGRLINRRKDGRLYVEEMTITEDESVVKAWLTK